MFNGKKKWHIKSEKLEILWTNSSGFNGLVPPRVPNRKIIDNLFL
jgi:hypothetical protein